MPDELFDPEELLRRQRLPVLGATPTLQTGEIPDVTPTPAAPTTLGRTGLSTPADLPVTPSTEPRLQAPRGYDPMTTPNPAQAHFEEDVRRGEPQLGGWKKGLDIAGQVIMPRLERAIPGTPGYYRQHMAELGREAGTEATLGRIGAETEREQAQIPEAQARTELYKAQTQKALESPDKPPVTAAPGSRYWDEDSKSWKDVGGAPKGGKAEQLEVQENVPIGWSDAQGVRHSLDDPMTPPAIKAQAEAVRQAHAQSLKETEEREGRVAERGAAAQARGFAHQEQMARDRENQLTNATKTMVEAAPKVKQFVQRVQKLVKEQQSQLGPAAGRWSEFWTGKVGAPNPEFARLRTDVGLLQTLLMRMHVGARGGEYIMQHFQNLIDSGKASPENLLAATDEIDRYADDLIAEGNAAKGQGGAKIPSGAPDVTSPSEWLARKRGR